MPSAKGGARKLAVSDEAVLNGILFVLQTGILWEDLPQSLGYGSGMTCWRRLRDWNASGVWQKLHLAMLVRLSCLIFKLMDVDTYNVLLDSDIHLVGSAPR